MKRAGQTGILAAIGSAIEVAAGAKRVHLFPLGTWKGRNGLGPYSIADRAQADAMVAATKAAQGPVDLMIDYDHAAVRAPGVAGKAIAAGWVRDLKVEEDGIWADVDWTATAAAHLEAREYRYASPYFEHDKTGRITRLINAALTNTPNFNLEAVAASALEGESMTVLAAAIAAALGLPAEATNDQGVAAIEKLKGDTSITAIATALGLTDGADATAIATGITALKTKAEAAPGAVDPSKHVPIEQLTAVNARLAVLEGDRAEAAIASAIGVGKLAPASKQWGLDLYKQNPTSWASFIATAPTLLAEGGIKPPDIDLKSDVMTADERSVASALGLSDEAFLNARKGTAA